MSMPSRNQIAMLTGATAIALCSGAATIPENALAGALNPPETTLSGAAQAPGEAPDSAVTFSADQGTQSYADLVDLALSSPVVAKATIRRQVRLKNEESPGLPAGFARLYFEADTAAVLVGPALGESLRFIGDLPLDAKGKVSRLVRTQVLLFGNTVSGKPGELALTAADTMFGWSPTLEARTRAILTELIDPNAPPRITTLREALHVPGNLAGEGETQFFFATANGKPVSISVIRRPGEPTRWGVSFSEIVDQAAQPPAPETLAWYRLACSLPQTIPGTAAISTTPGERQIAMADYAWVLGQLGPCRRNPAGR